jgi:hypothetical protein
MARRSRSRDLAGLAALGALGFMAGKGLYKKPGEALAPVEDRVVPGGTTTVRGDTSPADLYADAVSGDFSDDREPGGSTLRPPVAPAVAPTATRSIAPRVSADTTTAASDEMMRGRGMNRAPTPAVIGPRSTGAGGPTAAEMAAYRRQQELDAMRGRGYKTQYKKGGAVKAKKMASGGMTSASKRADGIATKGKTKCKMY